MTTKFALNCASYHTDQHGAVTYERFTIDWMDGKTRCHVWAGEDIVHRNTPTGETYPDGREKTTHRAADLSAKKYADVRAFIAGLDNAALGVARRAYLDKKTARDRAEADAHYQEQLAAVPYMRKALAEGGDRALNDATCLLSDTELLRLHVLLVRGKTRRWDVKNGHAAA